MRIEEEIKLDYSDVLFRPKRSTLRSRKDVNLNRKYNFKYSKLSWKGTPIIASNMDGVGEIGIAKKLTSYKVMTALTKQHSVNQISEIYKKSDFHTTVALSCGTSDDSYKRLNKILQKFPKFEFICIDVANINKNDSFIIGASIELIHSYSLIHDDLPSMDNDDFRRGKLSTHKKFNEATAILAGDALHDLAFTLLSGNLKNTDHKSKLDLINYLSLCIGHKGLALGQSLDLEFENKKTNKREILNMYLNKTGKLFEFSFSAPFILANAKKSEILFAKEFGGLFGLIFQVIDDLIDEIGTFKKIGKTPGKDVKQGKSTLLGLIGEKKVTDLCKNKIGLFEKKHEDIINSYPTLISLLNFGMNRIS